MKRLFRTRWTGKRATEGAFTRHVRALEKRETDAEGFAELHQALRLALRTELRRRGLWNSPPSYLGVVGWGSWDERSASGEDALDELCSDAYPFVFIDRSRSLRAHLAIKPDIDGMVILALHQFVQERQEKHDPLGAQVFVVLRSAVREAIKAGELHLLRGSDRIGNDTVLGFAAGTEAEPREVDFRPLVARWNGLLMPDLVTNRGRLQEEVVRRLRDLLPEMQDEGVEVFRFKELIDPLKADVRARWAFAFEQEGGETGMDECEGEEIRRVRLVQPDLGVEERQYLQKVIACVLESVAHLEVSEAMRGYLYRLWQFRRMQAVSGGTGDDRMPSARKLGELLKVPRERIAELLLKLDELVEQCRVANLGKLAVTSLQRISVLGNS